MIATTEAALEATLESTRESAGSASSWTAWAARVAANTRLTKLVIARALPRVRKNLIGVVDLLEFGCGIGSL